MRINSYHPIEHKNSVVRSLINRATAICDPQHVKEEIFYVSNVSKLNGYDDNVTQKIMIIR